MLIPKNSRYAHLLYFPQGLHVCFVLLAMHLFNMPKEANNFEMLRQIYGLRLSAFTELCKRNFFIIVNLKLKMTMEINMANVSLRK